MSRREPFLVNPHIGILNPSKKRGKRMAKKWGKGHMAWVRSFQRKRRKSNPWPVAGMVSANPRHRRSRKAHNPRRRKRNPSEAPSMNLFGLVSVPSVNTLLYTGGGFIAPPFIENAFRPMVSGFLPGGTAGRYILKVGAVILTSVGARFFGGRSAAKQAALGGSIYVLASVWSDFVAPYFAGPSASAPVAAYVTGGTPGAMRTMRSYVPGRNTMGMPSAAVGGGNSGAIGGTADRFKRF
jgi:hypothetical protein